MGFLDSVMSGLGSFGSSLWGGISNNPLQALGLGLGLGGDIMHGISSMENAKQMRDIRQKAMDPQYMNAMTNQYYENAKNALQQQLPNILRQTVNPLLGMRGLDPAGGNGRLIMDQAIAGQLMNAYAQSQNMAAKQLGLAGQFIEPAYGKGGNLPNMLMMYGMRQGINPSGSGMSKADDAALSGVAGNWTAGYTTPSGYGSMGLPGTGAQHGMSLDPSADFSQGYNFGNPFPAQDYSSTSFY